MPSLKELSKINGKRSNELAEIFNIRDWSIAEWTNAMAGEAGEACNFAKKMRRQGPNDQSFEELKKQLGKELADVVLYADLTAQFLGLNLEDLVIQKFNEVSDRYDSPIRMPIATVGCCQG